MRIEARRTRPRGVRALAAAMRAAALALAGAVAAAAPEGAAAQTANRVEAFRDWSVFTADDNGPVCWIATEPKSSEARRGGQLVRVRRGDIYLMVAVRPRQGVESEISFVAGYPIRDGSEPRIQIGSDRTEMFSEGENAWPRPEDDAGLVESMRAGVTAVVTAVSSRGTTTTDRFSLLGFTDALTRARELCG